MSENAAFDDPGTEDSSEFPTVFRAAVTAALTEIGQAVVSWEPDGVNVHAPRSEEENSSPGAGAATSEQYIGLSNLYRRVRAEELVEWPKMIREFLQHLTGAVGKTIIPDDLMTVAEQLRPRLGRPFPRDGQAFPWGIPLPGTGLEINLVIDYPNTMAYVTESMLQKTGKSGEDLLDVALTNLRADTESDFFELVSDELDVYVGHTGDGYDSARALLIEDLLPESPAGFWVAIPSREELVTWPVSFEALAKIHVIKMFAQDNFRDHAYPVTDDVFWVWNGTWYRFGIQVDEQNVTVSPPDEFLVALKSLGADAGPRDGNE